MLTVFLSIVNVMKKHLRKAMEDVNGRITPKPSRVGYQKWDKDNKS